jgi:hypothetical protein
MLIEDYANLETYLCYECRFHADTILMQQKCLYQQYQSLFSHSKGVLVPKKVPPTRNQHGLKHEDDSTEPKCLIELTPNPTSLLKQITKAVRPLLSMIPVVVAVAITVLLANSRMDFRYNYYKFGV